ncbi:low molecular weight protein tyrosine phosphatase family protein [Sedimentitalea arenosa]|uniref:Phosphotyrosine protein phosphatase n=1 Tax=Sedimentitalea arenosa TaxID=2798803 RepID=A0A8J7LW78_9RHOB|nr:phosphotyrosine protein phosphatase [Arenibacterium arenosum]MBJ6371796.1 phosphotyrosine protein phosphatase [Arenibacterium arenosum]
MSPDSKKPLLVLFVCTANKLRSPTAEDVFKDYPGIQAVSAGTDASAPRPLTKELVASADWIFAMETHHRERIRKKYKQRPPDNRIITLHIPDEYERGDPELVALLKEKVEPRIQDSAVQ